MLQTQTRYVQVNKQYFYFDKGLHTYLWQMQWLMRLNAHSHYVFYQKTLKDGDMKVTWMQYEGLLVQRLNRIKCINSNFSEVLSSLIVLGLETLAIINTTKECICLRFLHLTTIIRYIFSHHKHYEKWYMFQFERSSSKS